MLYSEIIAVCSQIHTKHINTLCGQNVELLKVKLVLHIVTTEHSAPQRLHRQGSHPRPLDHRYILHSPPARKGEGMWPSCWLLAVHAR